LRKWLEPTPSNSSPGKFPLVEAQQMAREVGLNGEELAQIAGILYTLYGIFRKYDTLIAEINPLVRTSQGTYVALDAKVEIDDSSLYRRFQSVSPH